MIEKYGKFVALDGSEFPYGDFHASRKEALLFYTNIASLSASGPNTCQQRVISCKR